MSDETSCCNILMNAIRDAIDRSKGVADSLAELVNMTARLRPLHLVPRADRVPAVQIPLRSSQLQSKEI
jgi:hypothetical protein